MARPPLIGFAEHRATRPPDRPHISGKPAAQAAFAQLCAATALLSSAAMTAPLTVRLVTAGPSSIDDQQTRTATTVPTTRQAVQVSQRTPASTVMNRLETLDRTACR